MSILAISTYPRATRALIRYTDCSFAVVFQEHMSELESQATPPPHLQSLQDAMAGRIPSFVRNVSNPTPADYKALSRCELAAAQMLDRWNWSGESVSSIRHVLHRYLIVWTSIIDELLPDALILHHPPHRGFDLVAWSVAKARGLQTGFTSPTPFKGAFTLYRNIDKPPVSIPREERPSSEGDLIYGKYFSSRMAQQRERALGALSRGLPHTGGRSILGYLGRLATSFRSTRGVRDQVPGHRHVLTTRKLASVRTYSRVALYGHWYERLATQQLPRNDFVLLLLHFQPEATTLPLGGMFVDQLAALRAIHRNLPEGVSLVVKEHHQMFRYNEPWPRVRDTAFQSELSYLSSQGVIVLSTFFPTTDAIASARITATVTGTAGWESLLVGTPVLAFGNPWYARAPGCILVSADSQVEGALDWARTLSRESLPEEVCRWSATELPHLLLSGPEDIRDLVIDDRQAEQLYAAGCMATLGLQ